MSEERMRSLEEVVGQHGERITTLEVKDSHKDKAIEKLEEAVKEGSKETVARQDKTNKLIMLMIVVLVTTNPELLPIILKFIGIG